MWFLDGLGLSANARCEGTYTGLSLLAESRAGPVSPWIRQLVQLLMCAPPKWYTHKAMGRKFNIPIFYRSSIISTIKSARRNQDTRKRDFSPSVLDLGQVRFKIARHFGFCFGVENAIEIAYQALEQNPDKRVFLLSEMIHNPHVNGDLQARGVRFILTPSGEQLVDFKELSPEDIVIVPAFGTTVELFDKLQSLGINPLRYNATCPFVEKVWKRAAQLGEQGYSIIIHGRHNHEETRATFSHAVLSGPSIVIRDIEEARLLCKYIKHELPADQFLSDFKGLFSPGFDCRRDLLRIGVVNQTTMLATETQTISDLLRQAMLEHYGAQAQNHHFADTRDTLCYATSENQDSIYGLLKSGGDLAIVVGGYNSSNTSHLVELCQEQLPTYYIKDADEIIDGLQIRHLDMHVHQVVTSQNWLVTPGDRPVEVILTAGASCPDALVDEVLVKVARLAGVEDRIGAALDRFAADCVPELSTSIS